MQQQSLVPAKVEVPPKANGPPFAQLCRFDFSLAEAQVSPPTQLVISVLEHVENTSGFQVGSRF